MSGKYLIIVIALAVLVGGGFFYRNYSSQAQALPPQEAGEKAISYINENMLGGDVKASLISSTEESGMYKIHFKIQEEEHDAYVSKDGMFLFPQAVSLEKTPQAADQETEKKLSCEEMEKSDQPLLEAFVVSKCPYGTQMQRILTEIVKNIPSFKENIKIEYLGSVSDNKVVSMHGEEEAEENLRQICLREEQGEKFWDYLGCHIKKGEVDGCLGEAGVDKNKLDGCMKGKGVEYAQKDFEAAEKYQVTGSPGLVLNGKAVDEQAFSKTEDLTMRSAEMVKTLLCCGFEQKPDFCSQELTGDPAATSFSETYEASSGSGGGSCQ